MAERLRYSGKVAIVTGGASGIGEAVVRELIAEGASVVAADINESGLGALAAELGERCFPVRTNVTQEAEVAAMVAAAASHFGRLDAAFNVAGSARMGPIVDQSEEDFRFSVELCLMGSFFCLKHEARQMISGGIRGAIVNVGSLNAQVPCWGLAAYSAAKAGLEMLGRSGALELAEHGIRVNTVSPGMTATPATSYMSREVKDAYLERIPLKRAATPQDQAKACLFLGSDDAAYITGVNLLVDGGWAHSAYPDMRAYFSRTPDTLS
jgi:NAD(P)-dependent dehydrogenase (short-subunit alcohol dehydrogenase family)